jgi:serine/threonine protein kinase
VLIDGRYRVTRTLGEGGMGIVYLAEQTDLGRRVAVKVLRQEQMTDADVVDRFRREARIVAKLTGPHVARILDFGTTGEGHPFMVLEYLEGNDLDEELELRGALPLEEAARIVVEACDGMREAHAAGVVHRDLKPGNLFLSNENGKRVVKILDFGISKLTADEHVKVTQTSSAFGTPLYMSPEHVRSTKGVDHRTDIWSLGVILYEAVTGTPPFLGETPTAVAVSVATETPLPPSAQRPGLPAALDSVLARALAKNPADRYPTVDDLADALRPFLTADTPSIPLPPRARESIAIAGALATTRVAPERSRRWLALAVGTALAGGIAAIVAAGKLGAPRIERAAADDVPSLPAQAGSATPSAAPASAEPTEAAASAAPIVTPTTSSSSRLASPPRTGASQRAPSAPTAPRPTPSTERRDPSGRPIVL